ncbi:beta-ketoacyl synthase [Larsenimonas rhizosphaerae]|uniref:Beta-ketoacyl synthase n=1 Tax=Larsenimonas rhizosphaerae TaxID=2944682 RepID=A0AA41ZMI4_9GAMM|nr:beta-ketoacyl synthase [Larsenimonas rhizosphaerae]MCX2524951.1 beta-ketoacyl synthase [Larsenimonas rhizosphaerae]
MGGINAAGRTSSHQSYQRTVLDALPTASQHHTLLGLASLMALATREADQWRDTQGNALDEASLIAQHRDWILTHTNIRRIEDPQFGDDGISSAKKAGLSLDTPLTFVLSRRQLPTPTPAHWQVREIDRRQVEVTVPAGPLDVMLPEQRDALVKSAGQLPTGFEPASFYRSVHHPRGLAMSIFGASDCLGQSGLEWQDIIDRLDPDAVAVYAGNSIGQLDQNGWGGLLQSFVTGQRATSKQMPLGYGQMPADFINAYVLGSVGTTGSMLGACATFLYNLRLGVEDIKQGRRRVVMVGTSDAPITPEVVEGFRVMSALADDASLKALDALELLTDADYQRASRPFARNCGFTIAEASQFILLMDDSLALEMGAQVLGSVPDVFVNADGWKRSISAPGIGNYLTLGKSVALARDLLGDDAVRHRSYIHAHGTSTPKNRTSESHVMDMVARAFGIENWPVAAIKAFIGHSQGSAAGDQMASALGTFAFGMIPGIPTLDQVADDVFAEKLDFFTTPKAFTADVSFINAKGFGGNNATAPLLSPDVTERLMTLRHGEAAMTAWRSRRDRTLERSAAHENASHGGHFKPTYQFGEGVLEGPELSMDSAGLKIPGYANPVSFNVDNPFGHLNDK